MNKPSSLYSLIAILNKQEKRYFKIYASKNTRRGSNNYIKLFDALDKQIRFASRNDARPAGSSGRRVRTRAPGVATDGGEQYDDKALKRDYAGAPFIKNLRITKHYLYLLILDSLSAYYSHASVDAEIRRLMSHIELLYKKALYEDCRKLIHRCKSLAGKYEKYLQMPVVIEWERKVIVATAYKNINERLTGNSVREMRGVLDTLANINDYYGLGAKVLLFTSGNLTVRSKNRSEAFDNLMKDPLLSDASKAISHQAKIIFYYTHAHYSQVSGDIHNACLFSGKALELTESHPDQIINNLSGYVTDLYNFLLTSAALKRHDARFVSALHKLKTVPDNYAQGKDLNIRIKAFEYYYAIMLEMHLHTASFDKGVALVEEIEAGYDKFKGGINRITKAALDYQIAYLYFGCGNHSKSLRWLNKLLQDSEYEIREDIQCFARIMNLVVHFELGNRDLLEYIVKSTYRFLYKRNRLYKIESCILKFIRNKIPGLIIREQTINAFKGLNKELEGITKDPFEKQALQYFDLIAWVESKITGVSFAEIVRRKAMLIVKN